MHIPLYPISSILSYNSLPHAHFTFLAAISSIQDSTTYKQSGKHPCWVTAMQYEHVAINQNKTWVLIYLSHGNKSIECKWIYKVKYKVDGTLERYKARLVAKCFTQIESIDFFYTYSLVAKLTTVRLLLSIASSQNWQLHQLDVHNVFLHFNLEEKICMQLPHV